MQPWEDGMETWERRSCRSSPWLLLTHRLYSLPQQNGLPAGQPTGQAQSEAPAPQSFPEKGGAGRAKLVQEQTRAEVLRPQKRISGTEWHQDPHAEERVTVDSGYQLLK